MKSLVDRVTKKMFDEHQGRHDSAREAEVAGRVDVSAAQAQFEARKAQEDAAWAKRRGPTVAREELDRRERERWDTISTLRSFRAEIESRRHDLIATRAASVEYGNLDAAIVCQQHLATFDVLAGIAASRLSALGVEVK